MDGLRIYEWPDGSRVNLVSRALSKGSEDRRWVFEVFLQSNSQSTGIIAEFYIGEDEGEPQVYTSNAQVFISDKDLLLKSKLSGFIFDLMGKDYFGISQTWRRAPSWGRHLFFYEKENLYTREILAPIFVSDQVWGLRHDAPSPSFLRPRDIEVCKNSPKGMKWFAKWNDYSTRAERRTDLFKLREDAIDAALAARQFFPESKKEEWIRTFLDLGNWLVPSPEEVEVFRILDEPLSFFRLPYDELKDWLGSRGITVPS